LFYFPRYIGVSLTLSKALTPIRV